MTTYACTYSRKHRQDPSWGPWCYWKSAAANKKNRKHFHLSGLGKRIHKSASICWYVDNTYGHIDIREVASNTNQINHRSQHAICLIMSNTSHFLSTQKALCERADGIAMGWHHPRQLQMQSIYTACWKNDTTQAASWEKDSNWTSVTKQNTRIYWCSELIWSSLSPQIKYMHAGRGAMLSRHH